jgi:hypothetical protein
MLGVVQVILTYIVFKLIEGALGLSGFDPVTTDKVGEGVECIKYLFIALTL